MPVGPLSQPGAAARNPDKPTAQSASAVAGGGATVSFTESTNPGKPSGNYVATSNPSGFTASSATSPITFNTGVLAAASTYTFTIVKQSGSGISSDITPATSSITAFYAPGAPVISVARQASQTIRITLSTAAAANGSDITSYQYRIKAGTGEYGSYTALSGTIGPWDIGSLSNGTTYTVQVRGVNTAGGGTGSNEPSAIPSDVPAQVSTPTSSAGDRTFSISWSAPSDGGSAITGYRVQWSSDNGATWNGTSTTTSTSFSWTLRNNGTSYIGKVQAYNANGDGSYSESSTARTPAFASAGTISVNEDAVSAPVYSSETNVLLTAGVGSASLRPVTLSFDPPNVSAFSHAQIFGAWSVYSYWQVGSNYTSNGPQSVKVSHLYVPEFVITVDIGTSTLVSFFMRTWNTDGDYIDTPVSSITTSASILYYTYDATETTVAGGDRNVDNKDYSRNEAQYGVNTKVSAIRVYGRRSDNSLPIATSQKHFVIRTANSTNYADAVAFFNALNDTDNTFRLTSGSSTKNLLLGVSNNYGTGFVVQILGNGTTAGTWSPFLVVSVSITYRNRYTNYW